jgi:hypothetical protein
LTRHYVLLLQLVCPFLGGNGLEVGGVDLAGIFDMSNEVISFQLNISQEVVFEGFNDLALTVSLKNIGHRSYQGVLRFGDESW